MVRRICLSAALLIFSSCATATPDLGSRIDRIRAAHPDQVISVAYNDLSSGEMLLRRDREIFHAASTMKVPVMLGIFEAVSRGELRLDQPVTVRNEFVSIFDGSTYALEAGEDSDAELYQRIGDELPLEELVRRMIVRSSNLATNIVIDLIGAKRIMTLMKEIGANDIQVLRGVEDDKAYRANMNNTTTAYDLMLIFRALGESRVISSEASEKMIEILAGQEHNKGIPAGLPPGTPVAHKTGWIPRISHDSGLVIRPDGSAYVLVVLTRGFEKSAEADAVIAAISRAVWQNNDARQRSFASSPSSSRLSRFRVTSSSSRKRKPPAAVPSPACGRGWREAPGEGFRRLRPPSPLAAAGEKAQLAIVRSMAAAARTVRRLSSPSRS